MTTETIDLLKLARDGGMPQAEVYRVDSRSQPVGFEANRLKDASRRDSSGVALRVIRDGRLGLSATTDPAAEPGLIDRVKELSQFGAPAAFQMPPPADYPDLQTYDPRVEEVKLDDMVETGQSLIDAVRRDWPQLNCDANISHAVNRVRLTNSAGVDAEYTGTSYSVGIGGELIRGEDMLFVWEGYGSTHYFADTDWMVKSVLQQLELAKETAPAPHGEVPVIFTPRGVVATLLSPLLTGLNGKSVLTGSSPLVDRIGEKVLGDAFSLYDDATIPRAVGSRPFDDEGVPSRRVPLIQDGVARNFLYDLQTAGRMGAESTGAAGRGLSSLPSPGTSVIDIAAGSTPNDDLFAGIKEGIVVERLLGAGMGNEMGGDFKANVLLGYKIENGRIVGRVKDTMIAGNVYETLSKIEAVSDTTEWVYGAVRTPAFRCLGVEVSASG